MEIIKSVDNKIIKELVKIRENHKYRNNKSVFFVEGKRIINDIPINLIDNLYINEKNIDIYKGFINKIDNYKIRFVSDIVFNKIKDTDNSQGIIATIKYNVIDDLSVFFNNNSINTILVLDDINDPGNLGTIIRTSEATGIDLIIISKTSCDIYNNKVVRSSMSALFRTNIYISNDLIETITFLKNNNFFIYSSVLNNNSKNIYKIKFSLKSVFILGNEANGIHNEIINTSDECIKIPMKGKIESLNVGIATSIICYERVRQLNYYEN